MLMMNVNDCWFCDLMNWIGDDWWNGMRNLDDCEIMWWICVWNMFDVDVDDVWMNETRDEQIKRRKEILEGGTRGNRKE